MDADPIIGNIEQPDLTEFNPSNSNKAEVLARIWEALESLTSPELLNRIAGLEHIVKLDAVRQYPLVVYVLMTRITEPDIELRTRIIQLLGSILELDVRKHQESSLVLRSGKENPDRFPGRHAYPANLRFVASD